MNTLGRSTRPVLAHVGTIGTALKVIRQGGRLRMEQDLRKLLTTLGLAFLWPALILIYLFFIDDRLLGLRNEIPTFIPYLMLAGMLSGDAFVLWLLSKSPAVEIGTDHRLHLQDRMGKPVEIVEPANIKGWDIQPAPNYPGTHILSLQKADGSTLQLCAGNDKIALASIRDELAARLGVST